MSWNTSFRGIFDDPAFTQPVTIRHGTTGDTDPDGRTDYTFGEPFETELLIMTPSAAPLEIEPTGPEEPVEYVAGAMLDAGLTKHDRVTFDDGTGPSHYRVGTPEVTDFDHDRFAWYRLTADQRGDLDGTDGTGGDGDYEYR